MRRLTSHVNDEVYDFGFYFETSEGTYGDVSLGSSSRRWTHIHVHVLYVHARPRAQRQSQAQTHRKRELTLGTSVNN